MKDAYKNYSGNFKKIDTLNVGGVEIEIPMELIDKTATIFQQRVLPFFESNPPALNVLDRLFKIQLIIFLIDNYYEQNWEIDDSKIAPLVNELVSILQSFGIKSNQTNRLLKDLVSYEKVERSLREGTSPDSLEIQTFYLLKSCDVRLQRELILLVQNGSIVDPTSFELDHDLLGEILDDIDDLKEDQEPGVHNGNRLLFSLQKDRNAALSEYTNFVNTLLIKNKHHQNNSKLANEVLTKLAGV